MFPVSMFLFYDQYNPTTPKSSGFQEWQFLEARGDTVQFRPSLASSPTDSGQQLIFVEG